MLLLYQDECGINLQYMNLNLICFLRSRVGVHVTASVSVECKYGCEYDCEDKYVCGYVCEYVCEGKWVCA